MSTIEELGFHKLSVTDKNLFDIYYRKMNDIWASSVCFASMITWSTSIIIYHRVIGDYLCCLAHDKTCDRWTLLPYIGCYDMEAMEVCTKEIIDIMDKLGQPLIFTDISSWMLPYYLNLRTVKLKESYDEGLSDYIYSREDFLLGLDRPYSRYDYNYFIKKNNPQLIEMQHVQTAPYLDYLKKVWCSSHTCDYCQYGCLLDSAVNLIEVLEDVGAKGITVYIDGQIAGYTIATMERDQLVFHLKKGVHGIRGLSEYMHRNCLELFGKEAKSINYTEDMNIEGLKRYKQKLAVNYTLQHKYELNMS